MFIAEVGLDGFRSFDSARIGLRPEMTVLIGENSSGKSAAIDALRLLTEPLDGRRSLWADGEDVHRPHYRREFGLSMTLRGSLVELAPYSDALLVDSTGTPSVRFTLTYQAPSPGESRGRSAWTTGSGAVDDDPDPGARSRIRHVYLPALRDASRELGPAGAPRIRAIIDRLLDDRERGSSPEQPEDEADRLPDREAFQTEIGEHLRQIEQNRVLLRASSLINGPLDRLTLGASPHVAAIGYGPDELSSLIRGLRMRMADAGVEPRDLTESGMGYANLAYIATVLTHLNRAAQADLTLLLVEEPEAHLHPQLQAILLDYLAETARQSQLSPSTPATSWLGRIQVVVTTHAPLFAAHSDVRDLVVLQRRRIRLTPPAAPELSPHPPMSMPATIAYSAAAVSVNDLGLAPRHLNRVNRYLDATRSSLLFGPRTLLVEGVAEALLLPPMAREVLRGADLVRFIGSTIVPIDGVDFEPYLRLLLTAHQPDRLRIGQRVAVLTDTDPGRRADPVAALHRLITELDAGHITKVFAASSTLEPELYEADNEAFWPAWARQRRTAYAKVKAKVEAAVTPAKRASILIESMKKTRLRKGDFAQDLLDHALTAPVPLRVPGYIRDALTWLVSLE